jgi:leucyl/phenylalanyl-tRNA--protein transferase
VSAPAPQAIEPPPSRWVFPSDPASVAAAAGDDEVIGIGADLEPGTLLAAYRSGLFPMPARRGLMAWWSPDPRGIVPVGGGSGAGEAGEAGGGAAGEAGEAGGAGGLRVSRSLRRSCARFEIRVDTAFDAVLSACGDRRRPGAWIDRDIHRAYRRLHDLGWAHSVEAWDPQGRLAGGLYGVAIGGLFAGESMFHWQTDASKVALVGLVSLLRSPGEAAGLPAGEAAGEAGAVSAGAGEAGGRLLDVQWATAHLRSLGAIEVSRVRYHEMLRQALALPQPAAVGGCR